MEEIGRICSKCKKFKEWIYFSKDRNQISGYRSRCKQCSGGNRDRFITRQEFEDKKLTGDFVKCLYCSREVYRRRSQLNLDKKHFCCRECQSKWVSENLTGEKAYNYRHGCVEKQCPLCDKIFYTRKQDQIYCSMRCKDISQIKEKETLICNYCKDAYKVSPSVVYWNNQREHKYNFCSKECMNKYFVGINSPNWIKDRSKIKDANKSLRWSIQMKEWREFVFYRDDYTCKMCGDKSSIGNPVILNAHHIKRFTDYPELRFSYENGITLCDQCHKKTYKQEEKFEDLFINLINDSYLDIIILNKKKHTEISGCSYGELGSLCR